MIASESVGGIYLPPLSDELIKEGLRRSADKREARVTQELLEKDANVISIWNNKRSNYIRIWITGGTLDVWNGTQHKHIRQHIPSHRDFLLQAMRCPETEKEGQLGRILTDRHIPTWVQKLVFPETHGEWINGFYDRFFHAPKKDGYGIPWGKIENYDLEEYEKVKTFYSSDKMRKLIKADTAYGETKEHHSDYALAREFVEETGLVVTRPRLDKYGNQMFFSDDKTRICDPLFERLAMFYQFDRKNPHEQTIEHAVYFFWVKDVAEFRLNEEGTPEEAERPEILPILSLNPRTFYSKHAHGLMMLLRKLINEYGMEKYIEPLKHLERSFEPCDMLRKEPNIKMPELTADEDMFTEFTRLNNIKPLK